MRMSADALFFKIDFNMSLDMFSSFIFSFVCLPNLPFQTSKMYRKRRKNGIKTCYLKSILPAMKVGSEIK